MNTVTAIQPVWARAPFLNALWVATSESPEWIVTHTDALLTKLASIFGVTYWQTHRGDRWEGTPKALAETVRTFVDRDAPTTDYPDGEPLPVNGYTFSVSGAGPGAEMTVRVSAGGAAVGRRGPRHTLSIDLRENVSGTVTSESIDAVCVAVLRTWKPAALELADLPVARAARRGGWKIGVGYRTWISEAVGEVTSVADGLSATELSGGTLVSAPDEWPADRVVAAMTETLSVNGLDEVPH